MSVGAGANKTPFCLRQGEVCCHRSETVVTSMVNVGLSAKKSFCENGADTAQVEYQLRADSNLLDEIQKRSEPFAGGRLAARDDRHRADRVSSDHSGRILDKFRLATGKGAQGRSLGFGKCLDRPRQAAIATEGSSITRRLETLTSLTSPQRWNSQGKGAGRSADLGRGSAFVMDEVMG